MDLYVVTGGHLYGTCLLGVYDNIQDAEYRVRTLSMFQVPHVKSTITNYLKSWQSNINNKIVKDLSDHYTTLLEADSDELYASEAANWYYKIHHTVLNKICNEMLYSE